MEKANATLRFLRMSPRKVRLVVNLVRGLDLDRAIAELTFNRKDASEPVQKLIESAAANAVNNHGMNRDLLFVETITVDDGPTMKRWMPRAQGRATPLRKRSSHINVILAERSSSAKATDGKQGKKEAKAVEASSKIKKAEPVLSEVEGSPAPRNDDKKKPAVKKAAAKKPAAKKAADKKN